jgi:hypothetical protein
VDKALLAIVNDFALWKGDSFRLAALIAEAQRELDRQKVAQAGYPEAAEAI